MESEIAGDSDADVDADADVNDRVPQASDDLSRNLLAEQSTLTTVAMLIKLVDEPETKCRKGNFQRLSTFESNGDTKNNTNSPSVDKPEQFWIADP
jgi:hypothetical protein